MSSISSSSANHRRIATEDEVYQVKLLIHYMKWRQFLDSEILFNLSHDETLNIMYEGGYLGIIRGVREGIDCGMILSPCKSMATELTAKRRKNRMIVFNDDRKYLREECWEFIIVPTKARIESQIRKTYDFSNNNMPIDSCPICMETTPEQMGLIYKKCAKCRLCICKECYEKVVSGTKVCPMCRDASYNDSPVRTEVISKRLCLDSDMFFFNVNKNLRYANALFLYVIKQSLRAYSYGMTDVEMLLGYMYLWVHIGPNSLSLEANLLYERCWDMDSDKNKSGNVNMWEKFVEWMRNEIRKDIERIHPYSHRAPLYDNTYSERDARDTIQHVLDEPMRSDVLKQMETDRTTTTRKAFYYRFLSYSTEKYIDILDNYIKTVVLVKPHPYMDYMEVAL